MNRPCVRGMVGPNCEGLNLGELKYVARLNTCHGNNDRGSSVLFVGKGFVG